ncbi:MAG: GTPase HflX [Synergistaceae bacterium]|nr:GTPase HflX [Synergistaceae bacterium]
MSRQKRGIDLSIKPKKAIVCGVDFGAADDTEVSLDELVMLLENLNIPTVARVTQKRNTPDPSTFIGSGKAEEIKDFALKSEATLLVIDDFLNPTQKSNLQKLTAMTVWDRSFVIMKIFESRAHTSEAKLQVELAQYRYEIPSLKGLGHQMSRTGGGIGTRGPGETEFERHRRKIERRIKSITLRLDEVKKRRRDRRDRRKKNRVFTVALVGYTNSGKSTLLRSLSKDFGILVANQLFSTLDTVVRKISFREGGSFLLSDTVGFIRKLPPELVAAFRATLEEVSSANLLLLVIDSSDKDPIGHMEIVLKTLIELEAEDLPRIVVLNKIDKARSETDFIAMELRAMDEEIVRVCALTGEGFEELLATIEKHTFKNSQDKPAISNVE